jgi:hypothetical protein
LNRIAAIYGYLESVLFVHFMTVICESILARFYYSIKPVLPLRLRWALRRGRAIGIRRRNKHSWPINPVAAMEPLGWPGWPDGNRFAFVLTHDVESLLGVEKIKLLAELEMSLGFRSSFNFIPEGGYRVPRELRIWLAEQGFEVGVHDLNHDGKLFQSRRSFKSKAVKINQHLKNWGASGFRSGFMLRNLDWLHELDALYDASTFDTDPFEPQSNGCDTIFPFFVSNPNGAERDGYVELPYTLPQDSTLFLLLGERSPDIWFRKLEWIVNNGGLALVNIHPDYINMNDGAPTRFCYPLEFVRVFLEHLNTKYAGQFWNPLPRELGSWYRDTCMVSCDPHSP